MSQRVSESQFCQFNVRLYREEDGSAHITLSCASTRLNLLEYATVSEAMPDYRTMCDTVRDVLACIRQDPNVGKDSPCEPGECVGQRSSADADYSYCVRCGESVDMRG